MNEMRQAIEELKIAEIYFNNALTKAEIDYATHVFNSAQAKVDFLSENEEREKRRCQ